VEEIAMALEPITLFSGEADAAGVARFLRDRSPAIEFDGPGDEWRRAVVQFGTPEKPLSIVLNHDPAYHREPNWSDQMSGMRGYFAMFPDTERKATVLRLTAAFRFSLGAEFEPNIEIDGDPRPALLFAVAELLDGVLFTPTSLLDARGRVLFSVDGADGEDRDATWPRSVR
jgi:hypothetical protein